MNDSYWIIGILTFGLLVSMYCRLLPEVIGNRLWAPQFVRTRLGACSWTDKNSTQLTFVVWTAVVVVAFIARFQFASDFCQLLMVFIMLCSFTAVLLSFDVAEPIWILILIILVLGVKLLTYNKNRELAPMHYKYFSGCRIDEGKGIKVTVGKELSNIAISSLKDGSVHFLWSQYYSLSNDQSKLVNKDSSNTDTMMITEFIHVDDEKVKAVLQYEDGSHEDLVLRKYTPSPKYAIFDAVEKAQSKLIGRASLSLRRNRYDSYTVACDMAINTNNNFFGDSELLPGSATEKIMPDLLGEVESQSRLASIMFVETFRDSDGMSVSWVGEWTRLNGLRKISDSATGYRVKIKVVPRP